MNKKFARITTLVASRLLGTSAVMTMTVWVLKYGMSTSHDASLLIRWAMVAGGMFLISMALDSLSEGFKACSDRAKVRKHIRVQEQAIAECDDYARICVNRRLMDINV